MAVHTPRRSLRIPYTHTPKILERVKGLFQDDISRQPDSLTKHRRLPEVDSESDSDDSDLGIITTIYSSSGEETDNTPISPERPIRYETRSLTNLKKNSELKKFIKSPFTLKKYQTRYSCPEARCSGSSSTPATPHLRNHSATPSSTHSCTSVHTTTSTSSKARKSLASLIADTESCSSSLKDLNFDSDSATESKENTPTKPLRRSARKQKSTPNHQSFLGLLTEQKMNTSPCKYPIVCLTKMDITKLISPTQMLKTPHNTSEAKASPPKLSHSRRPVVEIEESPASTSKSEKSHKRLCYDGMSDTGPNSKCPRLDPSAAPKARLSLFNSDRLKEILSAKSFYGKRDPDLNATITAKISNAIQAKPTHYRRPFSNSHSHRHKRIPGQINVGVKHKIRKPKYYRSKYIGLKGNTSISEKTNETLSKNVSPKTVENGKASIFDTSTELVQEKGDLFVEEQQTIETLLSQWTEEEVPESELSFKPKSPVPCFDNTIIEETSQIFQPVTAVPVAISALPENTDTVIIELGMEKNGDNNVSSMEVAMMPQDVVMIDCSTTTKGINLGHDLLPVDGGYIVVENKDEKEQAVCLDLDKLEEELKMLDEQILRTAQSNNMNAEAVLASTEADIIPAVPVSPSTEDKTMMKTNPLKVFPIFSQPNPGVSTKPKGSDKSNKYILKSMDDQYLIDAGQKRFGATQCKKCGVIYQIGNPQDEHDHLIHHNSVDVLKFNGWKDEYVVERTKTSRCIRVRGGDPNWHRVEAVLKRVVDPELGYQVQMPKEKHVYTAYLYVEMKKIIGCVIVEPKVRAHKLLPGNPDCCSVEDYPVKCGVSRVWTHVRSRRRGVASKLLDCVRISFLYGSALQTSDLAFSTPTEAGKALFTKYTGTENFFVYM